MMTPKCPVCGAELIEEGYPDEIGYQRYRCPNGCEFETPLSWKLWNAFASLIIVVVCILFTVAFLPYRIVSKI